MQQYLQDRGGAHSKAKRWCPVLGLLVLVVKISLSRLVRMQKNARLRGVTTIVNDNVALLDISLLVTQIGLRQ